MVISIYTNILPRLEAFFLEEWVEHHIALGVSKFYLRLDDLPPSKIPKKFKSRFKNMLGYPWREDGVRWFKKPNADYFLDFSDREIKEKLNEVREKYPNNIVFLKMSDAITKKNKKTWKHRVFRNAVVNNPSDWWLRIDADEYIFLETFSSLQELINSYEDVTCFRFLGKIFKERGRNQSTRGIFEWGYKTRDRGSKSLIVSDIKSCREHRSIPRSGKILRVPRTTGEFFHYRGSPQKHLNLVNTKRTADFSQIDDRMLKYIM